MVQKTQIPSVSLLDSLYFNLVQVIPNALQGLFSRRRFWVSLFTRLDTDRRTVSFCHRLRRKHGSSDLFIRVFTTRSLLLMDLESLRRVLDNSPLLYADPRPKRQGMSHFQPNAVTISRGEDWRHRRSFNEAILGTGQGAHRLAESFVDIVRGEVAALREGARGSLSWPQLEELFEKTTLQVIFGRSAREEGGLADLLQRMMRESNRLIGLKKSRYFDDFYAGIRRHLEAPEPGSLVSLVAEAETTERTRVENQIPHWMFAMNGTLGANTARALALIASHPEAEGRVREEMAAADLSTARGVHGLKYLEGCVQEAMRLWPTTPLLSRELLADDTLAGATVPAGTQILILNTFHHRDRETHEFAHTFSPEIWLNGRSSYHFNHFSNGPQICAGIDLALFLAKAVLAHLLAGERYVLQRPALAADRPLPHMLNYFDLRFAQKSR